MQVAERVSRMSLRIKRRQKAGKQQRYLQNYSKTKKHSQREVEVKKLNIVSRGENTASLRNQEKTTQGGRPQSKPNGGGECGTKMRKCFLLALPTKPPYKKATLLYIKTNFKTATYFPFSSKTPFSLLFCSYWTCAYGYLIINMMSSCTTRCNIWAPHAGTVTHCPSIYIRPEVLR